MSEEKKTIKTFVDLIAWQKGHSLVLGVYELTKKFPADEKYGLTSQIKRAGVSVTSNIAEGFGRKSFKEKAHFYFIANGSLTEVQNQLLIARDTKIISEIEFNDLFQKAAECRRVLIGLIRSTEAKC